MLAYPVKTGCPDVLADDPNPDYQAIAGISSQPVRLGQNLADRQGSSPPGARLNGVGPLLDGGKDAKTSHGRLVATRMEQENWTWLLLPGQGVVFFIVAQPEKNGTRWVPCSVFR